VFIKFLNLEAVKFYLIANILGNAIVLLFLNPFSIVKIAKKEILELLSFALPLMLVNLIGEINSKWIILSLNFFLPSDFYKEISKNSIIGIVSMNCKVGAVIGICIQAFRSAFDSMIFKKENDNIAIHQQTMHYFIIVISFIWFALSINKNFIAEVFFRNEIYKQGLIVIPFIGFYHMCNGIYYNISIYFKKINKTIFNFIFAIISLVTNIFLSFILIPHIGYIGSLIANISGILFGIVLSYWKNNIRYRKIDVVWILIPMVIIYIHDIFIKSFLITILITIFYFFCVLLFLYKNDVALKNFIKSKIGKR
jgi:O-antigen/teichoic acid export membrane protein